MADESGMTKEEKKFLMRSLWDALAVPKWTKDSLVDFGTAIFAKKSLKDMDDKTFNKIFPFLNAVTTELGSRLQAEAQRQVDELMESKEEEKNGSGEAPEEAGKNGSGETPEEAKKNKSEEAESAKTAEPQEPKEAEPA